MSEALQDELISIDAIYGAGTLVPLEGDNGSCILTLPARPSIAIKVQFTPSYPEQCPKILGPAATGQDAAKGEGQQLAQLLEAVLGELFMSGEPVIFSLIEECTARLEQSAAAQAQLEVGLSVPPQDELLAVEHGGYHNDLSERSVEVPAWMLSEVVIEKKSVFVARVVSVSSPTLAQAFLNHLITNDKKVARATHNITAWRIRGENGIQYQDCDDDGETAAGGRLLHLLELVDAWDVMVVVTRWYGGVHLGPDRFRLINQVARDALVAGGYADASGKKKGKK